MCHVKNSEMRKRIVLIAAAYIRMREKAQLKAEQINVKVLTYQYGFKNFTRIALLSKELEKMIAIRATLRSKRIVPMASESCANVFQALGV